MNDVKVSTKPLTCWCYTNYLLSSPFPPPQILGELCQQPGLHGQHHIPLQGGDSHQDDNRELQA